ncbi:MAG: uncharacterized protein KVP18_003819, partial [Porospora cf. gigantea A]|uniref:uncharacterized protein n=2 Tax=Porospora cf. gigantea A TaxID=2853593 RepID=UPI00355A97C5
DVASEGDNSRVAQDLGLRTDLKIQPTAVDVAMLQTLLKGAGPLLPMLLQTMLRRSLSEVDSLDEDVQPEDADVASEGDNSRVAQDLGLRTDLKIQPTAVDVAMLRTFLKGAGPLLPVLLQKMLRRSLSEVDSLDEEVQPEDADVASEGDNSRVAQDLGLRTDLKIQPTAVDVAMLRTFLKGAGPLLPVLLQKMLRRSLSEVDSLDEDVPPEDADVASEGDNSRVAQDLGLRTDLKIQPTAVDVAMLQTLLKGAGPLLPVLLQKMLRRSLSEVDSLDEEVQPEDADVVSEGDDSRISQDLDSVLKLALVKALVKGAGPVLLKTMLFRTLFEVDSLDENVHPEDADVASEGDNSRVAQDLGLRTDLKIQPTAVDVAMLRTFLKGAGPLLPVLLQKMLRRSLSEVDSLDEEVQPEDTDVASEGDNSRVAQDLGLRTDLKIQPTAVDVAMLQTLLKGAGPLLPMLLQKMLRRSLSEVDSPDEEVQPEDTDAVSEGDNFRVAQDLGLRTDLKIQPTAVDVAMLQTLLKGAGPLLPVLLQKMLRRSLSEVDSLDEEVQPEDADVVSEGDDSRISQDLDSVLKLALVKA